VKFMKHFKGGASYKSLGTSELGTHPASYPVNFLPGVNRPVHEADRSRASSAEVKSALSDTSASPYISMARCLIKSQDTVVFTVTFAVSGGMSHCQHV
jgi:hypothetical protein